MKKLIFSLIALIICNANSLKAENNGGSGVVNFVNCVTDSKFGKHEQEQLENLRKQWTTLLEETEKQLKDISAKFEDQEYMDGLSPEAEEDMKAKYKSLNEDMNKYQSQLYQIMQQANYLFMQKMASAITRASEKIAQELNLDLIINKEACFFYKQGMDITNKVISKMDDNYSEDLKKAENEKAKSEEKIVDSKVAPTPENKTKK